MATSHALARGLARALAALSLAAAPATAQVAGATEPQAVLPSGASEPQTHPTPPPLVAQLPAPSVHMRVRRGWARQQTSAGPLWSIAGGNQANGTLQGPVQSGLRGSFELTAPEAWRAVIDGPAQAEVSRVGGRFELTLERFERVLLDVTSECRVRLPHGQNLRVLRGLVELTRNVDGSYSFRHHGGLATEVDLGGRYTLVWRPGSTRLVPPRLAPAPAARGGVQLAPGNYRTFPQRADGRVLESRVPPRNENLLDSLWPF